MDSCVSAASAVAAGLEAAFLHASYGQLTEARELQAFQSIAGFYGVKEQLVVRLDHLRLIGGSALVDPLIRLPAGETSRDGIPVSYVPFRNANLLAAAASWAEVLGAGKIFVGAVEEDSSGYPDCRQSFFTAFEEAIREGTKPDTRIKIVTPLLHLRKKEIVELGMRLGAPLHLTWSCYRGKVVACGQCDSCLLRLRGFREAGLQDPVLYEKITAER